MTTNQMTQPALRTPHDTDRDPRAVFTRAVTLAGSVMANVRPEQLDDPTPCDEYDVRQLLGHLIGVLRRVATWRRGQNPFSVPTVAGDVANGSWPQAWAEAAREAEAAWSDDAVLERVIRLPWAELPGAAILAMYTSEVTVHTWDLATATGQRPEWDAKVLEVALASIQVALPAEGRAERLGAVRDKMPAGHTDGTPPFAEAVPIAADAPLIDRLVAWTGRRP